MPAGVPYAGGDTAGFAERTRPCVGFIRGVAPLCHACASVELDTVSCEPSVLVNELAGEESVLPDPLHEYLVAFPEVQLHDVPVVNP